MITAGVVAVTRARASRLVFPVARFPRRNDGPRAFPSRKSPASWGLRMNCSVGGSGRRERGPAHDRPMCSLGWGSYGQLGFVTPSGDQTTPGLVSGGIAFTGLTAGGYNRTCGLTSAGAAYCWGYNAEGQLGEGTTTNRTTPTSVLGGLTFTALTGGGQHTCGVTSAGSMYCWGANGSYQLGVGDGSTTSRSTPTLVIASNGP